MPRGRVSGRGGRGEMERRGPPRRIWCPAADAAPRPGSGINPSARPGAMTSAATGEVARSSPRGQPPVARGRVPGCLRHFTGFLFVPYLMPGGQGASKKLSLISDILLLAPHWPLELSLKASSSLIGQPARHSNYRPFSLAAAAVNQRSWPVIGPALSANRRAAERGTGQSSGGVCVVGVFGSRFIYIYYIYSIYIYRVYTCITGIV
nr:RecName: Full=Uncharacterized gene E5 protein [Equid herpesvirus type 2 strain 86/87]